MKKSRQFFPHFSFVKIGQKSCQSTSLKHFNEISDLICMWNVKCGKMLKPWKENHAICVEERKKERSVATSKWMISLTNKYKVKGLGMTSSFAKRWEMIL